MASSFACRACKRALQQRASSFAQATRSSKTPSLRRPFSLTSTPRAAPHSTNEPSIPAETPANNATLAALQEQRTTPGNAHASASTGASEPSPDEMRNNFAAQLRRHAGGSTETYVAYGGTEMLFRECARQADYRIEKDAEGEAPKTAKGEDLGVGEGWWYEVLGLTPTFNTWAQITFLHMYVLTVRLRKFPAEHAPAWHQHLLDHFFYEAENRMVVHHNMQARGIRNRYLQDLFIQWRGVMAAYDEGLVKGDAVLATALWRNIWKAEEINPTGLATLVAYLRREVQRLDGLSDGEVTGGHLEFEGVESEAEAVMAQLK